jgi:hypothetical protein
MSSALAFQRLEAGDLFEIERQESQLLWLGQKGDIGEEAAEILASQKCAWTAWHAGRIVACFGISEIFPDVQGVAWALLSAEVGAHHLELTRFMQNEIRECGLVRLELLAKASEKAEAFAVLGEELRAPPSGVVLLAHAMKFATPECRWAKLLGFTPAHVLRRFGAASETYMLFEWFGPLGEEDS